MADEPGQASPVDGPQASAIAGGGRKSGPARNFMLFGLKIAISAGCLFLAMRQIEPQQFGAVLASASLPWMVLAIALISLEVPLVGERWRLIVTSLGNGRYRVPGADLHAANGFGQFASQVLPTLVGDGVRALLLKAHGVTLVHASWSVLLDRATGAYTLFMVSFLALMLPSALDALGGQRRAVLIFLAVALTGGALALALAKWLGERLEAIPRLRFFGLALSETHRALFGRAALAVGSISLLVHSLTILAIFSLGRALGINLPLIDAMVLTAVMIGVTLVPISIGGWGLRELAVTSVLAQHGATAELAVALSVAFGLSVLAATVPGSVYWLLCRNNFLAART